MISEKNHSKLLLNLVIFSTVAMLALLTHASAVDAAGVSPTNSTTSSANSTSVSVNASSTVPGVKVYDNGTISASINGVPMKFFFDPNLPIHKTNKNATTLGPTDPTIRVLSDDFAGNPIKGMYIELQNAAGADISSGYSPISFATTTGVRYDVYANNYQSFVFKHWDDGSTDPARSITPSQNMTLTAYYSTGSSNTTATIIKLQSGLAASDPLNNETMTQQQLVAIKGYWTYDGDAPDEGAKYDFSRDAAGLHIGVQAPSDGTWAGFFAESQNHTARLWHARITNPVRAANGFYENGIYVQTANGLINYVACTTLTNNQDTVWAVISSTGNYTQVTNEDLLYMDTSPNQPLTRDCSIITNGSNYLKVYMDGNEVYTNSNLDLKMPEPFNAYLEPESTDGGQFLEGTFDNYYVADDEKIKITDLQSNAAAVDLANGSKVLASAQVSGGSAELDVGKFAFPISATIQVYDSGNNLIASGHEDVYGGDVYSISTSAMAPVSPTALKALGGNGQVSLSWIAPSSNGGSPIANYNLYRSTSSGMETFLVKIGNVTSYTDSGLANGKTYFYKVTAANSAGESAQSNEASAIPKAPATVPSAPTNLVATAESQSQISLSWQPPSSNGNSDITGYMVERSTNSGTTWSEIVPNTGSNATSFSDPGLAAGTTYSYRVSAINSVGTSPPSNVSSATTASSTAGIPSPPTGLVATPASYSQINLSWVAPSSDGGYAISGYVIERSANGGSTWSAVVPDTGTTTTSFSDSGLAAGKTYLYRVSATNSMGASLPSNVASATTLVTAPSSPTNLSATAVSSSEIDLSWVSPGWNGGASVTGYMIERSTDGGSTWSKLVSDTESAGTAYSDKTVTAGITYYYRVSAINSAGDSTPSNVDSATP